MLKMNQKGVSLPVVMLITALIAANSYYFISLNKNAKSTNVSQTTELKEEAEKRRIAAFLADYTVCNANFLGRSITALKNNSTMTSLSKNTVVFFTLWRQVYGADSYIK